MRFCQQTARTEGGTVLNVIAGDALAAISPWGILVYTVILVALVISMTVSLHHRPRKRRHRP